MTTTPSAEAATEERGRITGFWHAGITVSDLDASIAFYCDVLGLELLRRATSSSVAERVWNLPGARGRIAFIDIPGSDTVIELTEFRDVEQHSASARPCDPAHGHVCFYVENLDELHDRLTANGYRTRSNEVVTLVDGAGAGGKAVYLIDPDGYHVELFERPSAR